MIALSSYGKGVLVVGFLSAILALLGCDKARSPRQSASSQFAVGQVWKYKSRPSEPDSRVIIGRIETIEKVGVVVHVKLAGLKIINPTAPGGLSTVMGHAPMTEGKLRESVTEVVSGDGDLSGFEEGYNTWLGHQAGEAGIFTITLSEIVDCMESAIAKGHPSDQ